MRKIFERLLIYAATLLYIINTTSAHVTKLDPSLDADDGANDTSNIRHNSAAGPYPQSYFGYSVHVSLISAHISFMLLAWILILPLVVMISIARSKWTIPAQAMFLVANSIGLIVGSMYNQKTPDLYKNRSHQLTGWLVSVIALVWVIVPFLYTSSSQGSKSFSNSQAEPLLTASAIAGHVSAQSTRLTSPAVWSDDSGHGTERDSASSHGDSRRSSTDLRHDRPRESQALYRSRIEYEETEVPRHPTRPSSLRHVFPKGVKLFPSYRSIYVMRVLDTMIERSLVVWGFVAIVTGVVVFGGIARGSHVYNVLAHFIKGGIFFWYGVLTLGRWLGCFSEFGWSWNLKPGPEVVGRRRSRVPTAEFTESFVIWLYGASNVFLEHLAGWGGVWTAQDLEHVSISVMFFGGGTLGMLIESKQVHDLLSQALRALRSGQRNTDEYQTIHPSYHIPMNPVPALVILLLGVMMSSHHQSSALSTNIHKQWGIMFVGFALARAVTYLLLYISPPKSYLPARPPSEIITSFCLVAGGLLFMVSNKDTIASLEAFELEGMFVFTVTMGLTCLLLAWITFVVAFKGYLTRVRDNTPYHKAASDF